MILKMSGCSETMTGYVGVGEVAAEPVVVDDFHVAGGPRRDDRCRRRQSAHERRGVPDSPIDLEQIREDALRGLGRINILVAGKTGVGKSALINAVFQ